MRVYECVCAHAHMHAHRCVCLCVEEEVVEERGKKGSCVTAFVEMNGCCT